MLEKRLHGKGSHRGGSAARQKGATVSELSIRYAKAADIPAVIKLAEDSVQYSKSPFREVSDSEVRQYRRDDLEILNQIIEDPNFVILMVYDGQRFVAHALIQLNHKDSATGMLQAWIYDVSVVQDYWHRGVGRFLMQKAEELARQQKLGAVGLGVTLSNERAVNFYRRLGFIEERIQMVKLLDH